MKSKSLQSSVSHKLRADYLPPDFFIDGVDLQFELDKARTVVSSKLSVRRRDGVAGDVSLILDGCDLELVSVAVDGKVVDASGFEVDESSLSLFGVPDVFCLEVVTAFSPEKNTALEGLYLSNDMLSTQCEAEGFRRITFYLDRPDVLSRFSTSIVADKSLYPVLLSNGNRVDGGELADGKHWVKWEDPFLKPCYLFALVAGDLVKVADSFVTASGREVAIEFFVEAQNKEKCGHAIASLKKAMKWDEDTFGLEYDLDVYMVVAVEAFNMGAMENKGLNIFNSQCVLADPKSSTDRDFQVVEAVIGHEYFHNWTGNRVTCRDWFQLSLKEGLTVFREQQFSGDMFSKSVQRIDDVSSLRSFQFPEDSGAMSHPVRPDKYEAIDNFYTSTVYSKGAEVIRMLHTLLGEDLFRRGMQIYFERHDGQAVTCDDFVAAMESAYGEDLSQFRLWYSQSGTPKLVVSGSYDEQKKVF